MPTVDLDAGSLIQTGCSDFEIILPYRIAHGGLDGYFLYQTLMRCIYRGALHSVIDTRFTKPSHNTLVKVLADMGYRKRKRSAPVLSTASAGLLARGQDPGPYRTPVHVGDPHACDESYAVEGIMAEMLVRGIPRYHVKWRDINPKLSTWEVAEHLQDDVSAAILAEFKAKQQHDGKVGNFPPYVLLYHRLITCGNVVACPNRAL